MPLDPSLPPFHYMAMPNTNQPVIPICRDAIDHSSAQGGPRLPDFREAGGHLAAEWHASHRGAY